MAAAKEALNKLEEQLNCPICLDTLTDPKLLQCHHVYCRKCLENLVKRAQQELICPNCRKVTAIPGGVKGLQSAFFINKLQDSVKELRNASVTADGEIAERSSYCTEHNKEFELYCDSCDMLICSFCAIKGGKHFGHDYELLSEANKKFSVELPALLEVVDRKIAVFSASFEKLDSYIEEVGEQLKIFEAQRSYIIDSPEYSSRIQYISEQELIISDQLSNLLAFRSRGLAIVPRITNCRKLLGDCCEIGGPGRKISTLKQAKKEHDEIRDDLAMICNDIDEIKLLELLDPSQCKASGRGLQMAAIDEEATAIVSMFSYTGKPYEEDINAECEIVSERGRRKVQGSVEQIRPNCYQVSYKPTAKGRYLLHVRVNGQEIEGSPFRVDVVRTPDEMVGYPVYVFSNLNGPAGVAVNREGEILVSEGEEHCISVFSPMGEKLRSFHTHNLRQSRLKCYQGIAVTNDGNILMTVTKAHRIYSFTAAGKLSRSPLRFQSPKCIAFNEKHNKVYVADGEDCIKILNPDLTPFGSFGEHGGDYGEFDDVQGITCDSTGKVFVADSGNHRIQVFTATGGFLRTFGNKGYNRGGLYYPMGITVDCNGIVFISEPYNHRVSFFTSDGRLISSIGRLGEMPGQFRSPSGIAVDANRTLYVCDSMSRVQAFSCKHVRYNAYQINSGFVILVFVVLVIVISWIAHYILF